MPALWTPLLEEPDKAEAELAISAIADALRESPLVRLAGGGLGRGAAGVALLFGYLAAQNGDDSASWTAQANKWIRFAVKDAAWHADTPFDAGPGIAWTAEHVCGLVGEAMKDDDAPGRDVDERLLALLDSGPWTGAYDLVTGLVGFGVYALEGLPRPSSRRVLERVIDRLAEMAVETDVGITWLTPPERLNEIDRQRYPDGYFDLGLAHGVSAVISLLAQVCAHEIRAATARPLVDKAVRWLLAQRNPQDLGSSFVNVRPRDGWSQPRRASRLAWCYGDLGISVALYRAAIAVDQSTWKNEALAIARRAAVRPFSASGVTDYGLCHGSAGVGHIFNRFYQATGEQVFREAAARWFHHAVQVRHPEHLSKTTAGLIEGAAGIGLALLAAIGTREPRWDRMMLLALS